MITWILIALHFIIAIILVGNVLLNRKEPQSMMAWSLAIILLPVIGVIVYFVFGEERIVRKAHRRRKRITERLPRRDTSGDGGLPPPLSAEDRLICNIAEELCGLPISSGNAVEVYTDAEEIYAMIEAAIRDAKDFVHLQYYIWREDKIGTQLRDVLIEKAREGVEVRLLLDAFGCAGMSKSFRKPLTDAGVKVSWFLTTLPIKRRWSLHLRNHRKLAIIDGRVAFMGSQNVGDEYRGKSDAFSTWYDCVMKLSGPVVEHLAIIFAEDWYFSSDEQLSDDRYYQTPGRIGECEVQVLATGPDTNTRQVERVLFAAFVTARERIWIASPYFVPSDMILASLTFASARGVEVRIVHPRQSDRKSALWAGRSFYDRLFEAGISVYELPEGMLHTKLALVDDHWVCVGSTNMDVRSFRLNFEIATVHYDTPVIAQLSKICAGYFEESTLVDPQAWSARGRRARLIEGAARLVAPLL